MDMVGHPENTKQNDRFQFVVGEDLRNHPRKLMCSSVTKEQGIKGFTVSKQIKNTIVITVNKEANKIAVSIYKQKDPIRINYSS